jgi:hypothetical protein
MSEAIYRDPTEPVRSELERRLDERRLDAASAQRLRPLYARRAGRVAAGAAVAAVALATFGLALLKLASGTAFRWGPTGPGPGLPHLTALLLLAWPAGAAAYVAAFLLARSRFGRLIRRREGTAGADPFTDLALLTASPQPSVAAARSADRLETASVALPLVGLSFAVPLTLHYFAGRALQIVGADVRDFDAWICASALVVGHAHLTLAVCAVLHARRLRKLEPVGLLIRDGAGWRALCWTLLASALPGVLFWGIPPLLTLFTGVIFIPAMFSWAYRTVARERQALALGTTTG